MNSAKKMAASQRKCAIFEKIRGGGGGGGGGADAPGLSPGSTNGCRCSMSSVDVCDHSNESY